MGVESKKAKGNQRKVPGALIVVASKSIFYPVCCLSTEKEEELYFASGSPHCLSPRTSHYANVPWEQKKRGYGVSLFGKLGVVVEANLIEGRGKWTYDRAYRYNEDGFRTRVPGKMRKALTVHIDGENYVLWDSDVRLASMDALSSMQEQEAKKETERKINAKKARVNAFKRRFNKVINDYGPRKHRSAEYSEKYLTYSEMAQAFRDAADEMDAKVKTENIS